MAPTSRALSPYEKRVTQALRDVREASEVEQDTLARAAGMHLNVYGRLERGQRHATVGQIAEIMAALNTSARRRTNVRTVTDLLMYAEGKIELRKYLDPGDEG